MSGKLDDILGQDQHAPRLGATQLARLRQLTGHYMDVIRWDGVSAVPAPAVAVLVIDAAHATRVETLVASLHENSLVIVLFGESPAFDLLKSRLHAHGSLGAQDDAAPHHVWWGGPKPPSVRTGMYRKEDTLFLSSFRRATRDADHVDDLVADFKRFGLDHAVTAISSEIGIAAQGSPKVDVIIEQWTNACRPVFWIDPHARLKAHPLLPQALGCDFAVHRQANGAMTTGALFFHQTEAARALLDIWQKLTRSHPNLPESFLLDQAWTLAASQRQIKTAWLPDSYWRTDALTVRDGAIIVGDLASGEEQPLAPYAMPLQSGRRFGRHQAPESHLVMKGVPGGRGPITVVIRDVLAAGAQDVAAAVEATASAFANDPGGFSQMEIVLCGWNDDIESVMRIEDYSWVLMTDPSERLQANSFGSLSRRGSKTGREPDDDAHKGDKAELNIREKSVLTLVDPALGARLKRSGKYRRSFMRRPDLAL